MVLNLAELLKINVEVDGRDPILQRVTNQTMIAYLTQRGFYHALTHDSGLAAYQHPTVKVDDGENEYLFDTGIDTNDDGTDTSNHAANVRQFLYDMQRFYRLKGEPQPTQLEILNDLL